MENKEKKSSFSKISDALSPKLKNQKPEKNLNYIEIKKQKRMEIMINLIISILLCLVFTFLDCYVENINVPALKLAPIYFLISYMTLKFSLFVDKKARVSVLSVVSYPVMMFGLYFVFKHMIRIFDEGRIIFFYIVLVVLIGIFIADIISYFRMQKK